MKKILIIDDDITFLKALSAKLELLTYQVITALDGEEGLIKTISEKPDLILLDIKMPKLDGISFLKKLRMNENIPKIPVIITSNLSTIDKISEGVSLGIKGYILKSNETLDTITKEVQTILNT
ncbi:MAG: Adenylate/guanylate cyclase [Parcubacteria group bacterium GW2011_GWC1_43_30]|nr:MAG: Adenylate/guanylate cyclase [Parcubacteria group bacterium GW2011_GWC1_43_30]